MRIEILECRLSTYNLSANSWNTNQLTYAYVGGDPGEIIRGPIEDALNNWAEVSPLVFIQVQESEEPIMRISFGAKFSNPLIAAVAGIPGNYDFAGDILFSDAALANSLRLEQVATHEIGHALGLLHSDVITAVMYKEAGGAFRGLHEDDVKAIQSVYGSGKGGVIPFTGVVVGEPFIGYSGKLDDYERELTGDRFIDSVFVAEPQGHVKLFDGRTGQEQLSLLAFPGFFGTVVSDVSSRGIFVTAFFGDNYHLKAYDWMGEELASTIG